jgi:hypothetical protein
MRMRLLTCSALPATAQTYKISERQITSRNTTGYETTTIPLVFEGNVSRKEGGNTLVLCNYVETQIRVGSSVLIAESAPTCCCPYGSVLPGRLAEQPEEPQA